MNRAKVEFLLKMVDRFPLVELHLLRSGYNRMTNADFAGQQKTCIISNTIRARTSSSCVEHGVREYLKGKYCYTTKAILKYASDKVKEMLPDAEDEYMDGVCNAIADQLKINGYNKDDKTTKQALYVSAAEAEDIARIIIREVPYDTWFAGGEEAGSKSGNSKGKEKAIEVRRAAYLESIQANLVKTLQKAALTRPVDDIVAINGRMCTSGIVSSVPCAVMKAHEFSTNVLVMDTDAFSVGEEFLEQHKGAIHLNDQDNSSNCFFGYRGISTRQAFENNMIGLDYENEEDIKKALRRTVRQVMDRIKAYIQITSKTKLGNHASMPMPCTIYVTVSKGRAQAITLDTAFDIPVDNHTGKGYEYESALKLKEQADLVHAESGYMTLNHYRNRYWCSKFDVCPDGAKAVSLSSLLDGLYEDLTDEFGIKA